VREFGPRPRPSACVVVARRSGERYGGGGSWPAGCDNQPARLDPAQKVQRLGTHGKAPRSFSSFLWFRFNIHVSNCVAVLFLCLVYNFASFFLGGGGGGSFWVIVSHQVDCVVEIKVAPHLGWPALTGRFSIELTAGPPARWRLGWVGPKDGKDGGAKAPRKVRVRASVKASLKCVT